MIGAGAVAVVLRVRELAVRYDEERLRYRRTQVLRAEIVGRVVRREPVAVEFGFTLRPDLTRFRGVIGARLDKSKTAAKAADRGVGICLVNVVGLVVDLDLDILAGGNGLSQKDL